MVLQPETRTLMSIEEFDRFVDLPENVSRLFEYIAGRAVEVPSNPYASKLALLIATLIGIYLNENDIGHLTGADGGYIVAGEKYIPDVGFISYTKQEEVVTSGYNPLPPDLAIEVISNAKNNAEFKELRQKITNYLLAGTTVWVFDWSTEEAEVHAPGQPVQVYSKNQAISGGDVLPGFELPLSRVYKSR